MNWDAIGAVGQMLGSMAVLVTLVYLASQVKYARAEYSRSVTQHRADAIRDLYAQEREESIRHIHVKFDTTLGNIPNPFEAALIERGATPEEARALFTMQLMFFNYRVQIIPYLDELTDSDRLTFESGIYARYGRPGVGRLFYEHFINVDHQLNDASRYIEALLKKRDERFGVRRATA